MMRRLILAGLVWAVCFTAMVGCGKQPAAENGAPMLKGRMPHPKGRAAQTALHQPKPKTR
jgi:hypothetical protein